MTEGDRLRRLTLALARAVPGYDGYADARRRRDTDRAVRGAAERRARDGRDALAAAQRDLSAEGRFGRLPALEAVMTRLARLIDRLESAAAGLGPWLAQDPLPEAARLALVLADADLLTATDDAAAAARALADTSAAAGDPGLVEDDRIADDCRLLGELVDALHGRLDARAAIVAAPAPPVPPAEPLVAQLAVGDRVRVLDGEHAVVGHIVWERRDRAVVLDDPAGGLRLWQDLSGAMVLFEAQAVAVPAPPEVVALEAETFRPEWSDAGRGQARDATGVRRHAAPRWLYAGDAGGWLWIEPDREGARVWVGLGVDAGEVAVL